MIKVVFRFVPGFEEDLQSKNEASGDLQSNLQYNLQYKNNVGLKSDEKLSRVEIKIQIVEALKKDSSYTYETLSKMFNISRSSVATYLKSLSEAGVIRRVGSDKDGQWEVL